MEMEHFDATLQRYATSVLLVVLNAALVVAILGVFGVETTTFAALIAAVGVSIGVAWSGLLSNLAAGAFLILLRPVRVGDFVTAGSVTGTVSELGLFFTTLVTPDNIVAFVGNNKILSDVVKNFSVNPYRRVDIVAQLSQSGDARKAMEQLRRRIAAIPNVMVQPGPDVEILELNAAGPLLAVRPYTHTDHYTQVYFDATRVIRETLGEGASASLAAGSAPGPSAGNPSPP